MFSRIEWMRRFEDNDFVMKIGKHTAIVAREEEIILFASIYTRGTVQLSAGRILDAIKTRAGRDVERYGEEFTALYYHELMRAVLCRAVIGGARG